MSETKVKKVKEEEKEEVVKPEREYGYKPDFPSPEWGFWADLVISDQNSQQRNKWLLQINDPKEMDTIMNRKKNPMKYGMIVDWDNAAAKVGKGVHPPHELLSLHIPETPKSWGIPVWLIALIVGVISFGALIAGVNLFGLGLFTMMEYAILLVLMFFFSADEFRKNGECHICGIDIPKNSKGLTGPNYRGKIVKLTAAGLCGPNDPGTNHCGLNTDRKDKIQKRRNQRWDSIKGNRIRGIFFRVYKDKITDTEYTGRDYKFPLDEGEDQMLESAEQDIHSGLKKMSAVRTRKRMQFIKRKTDA